MARDYLEVGCAPYDEPCAQVGRDDYYENAREECRRYVELLRKKFGEEPEGARLALKSNRHDFGTYYEVACYYDTDCPESQAYAFAIEAKMPARWDDDTPVEWRSEQGTVADHEVGGAHDHESGTFIGR